jgi:hypothetical protein
MVLLNSSYKGISHGQPYSAVTGLKLSSLSSSMALPVVDAKDAGEEVSEEHLQSAYQSLGGSISCPQLYQTILDGFV